MRRDNNNQMARLTDAQERENKLSEVRSRILVNDMWNGLNRIVIEGDESLRTQVGTKNFAGLDASLIKRIYIQFYTINVIEVNWLLRSVDAISKDAATTNIIERANLLRNDPEATRYALSGRGYAQPFKQELWNLVFPDDPLS